MTAFDLLKAAAGFPVQVVQIADNLPLAPLSPEEVKALRRGADELGLSLEVGTCGISPANLEVYLERARVLGSPLLRVVIDTPEHVPDETEIIETLRSVMGSFEAAGVVLAIENHDRFPARSLRTVLQHVGSEYLGICLDTVNSLAAGETVDTVLEVLGDRVVNLHVKDFTIQRANHRMGFSVQGCPAGRGLLDIGALLEKLREAGRAPSVVLEQWPPFGPNLANTIKRERAWAETSLEYLRRQVLD